ncbi:hypothetical protein DCE79_08360 [Lysinibacillus sp. 2017]|uniref:hypothetical protein n=1 Tax=unclassified Lysinibacillus TaxID=2636778 RepID=UPI000D5268C3|nr:MULTISPECIES: hypothetical protein [unclassified Lysinibacillus]AWE07383.1 hypothetical protein DCE79_08360 [Lysinibacillus sp. 2017]TGN36545.1 hypothetical protein E4L99_03075 [Lysinibacillus sp. S2017]
MYKKFILIMVILFLIGGGIGFYISSKASPEKQAVSSTIEYEPVVKGNGTEASSGTDYDMERDQLRDTLNLSFRIINAMINKDYAYLENVIDPSVTLNRDDNIITFTEVNYESELMERFDYNNFEFRGYMRDGEHILIILGVYNVTYEFKYVENKNVPGTYLLKSILTN